MAADVAVSVYDVLSLMWADPALLMTVIDLRAERRAGMPIKIMLTDRGAAPVIVCDICGAWIERVDDGACAWNEVRFGSGTLHEVAFVHKGRCFLVYEAEHGSSTRDMPLEVLLPYLAANLDVDSEGATSLAKYFSTP